MRTKDDKGHEERSRHRQVAEQSGARTERALGDGPTQEALAHAALSGSPRALGPRGVLALHRMAGNAAVTRLLRATGDGGQTSDAGAPSTMQASPGQDLSPADLRRQVPEARRHRGTSVGGIRAVSPLLQTAVEPRSGPPTIQRLMSTATWKNSTKSRVKTRGKTNPELLQIDAGLAQYHLLTDHNDPDLEQRFQVLTDIETTVYSWYDRRYSANKAKESARLTAMFDLLDEVAEEHEDLVDRIVQGNKDLPVPNVGGNQVTKGSAQYNKIQTMWQAIVNETGAINFSSQDAKKKEDYPDFKKKMLPQFARLLRTPTGRKLIKGLLTTSPTGLSQDDQNKGLDKVTIRPTGSDERAQGRVAAAGLKKFEAYRKGTTRKGGGKGMGSYLSASPVASETGETRGGGGGVDTRGRALLSPLFIILAHEMVHILHNLQGENCNGSALADWENLEEKLTISGKDENDNLVNAISEQGMRGEYGLTQERFGH